MGAKASLASSPSPRMAYRVSELVFLLGLPKSTLYDVIRRGELRAVRSGRVLLVFCDDLEKWKQARQDSP